MVPLLTMVSTTSTVSANPGWWDSSWSYRRVITISPLNPENFQIRVDIPSAIAKSDYPSIRFLENESSGPLPYWIERNEGSYLSVAWVRRLENSDNTIYMYYGNGSATSAENGDNTFLFFDDFGNNALDSSKWDRSTYGIDVYQYTIRLKTWEGNEGKIEHGEGKGLTTEEENTRRVIETRMKNTRTYRGGILLTGPGWDHTETACIFEKGGGEYRFWCNNFPNTTDGGYISEQNHLGDVYYVLSVDLYGDSKDKVKSHFYYGNDNAEYRVLLEESWELTHDWAPTGDRVDKYALRGWDDSSEYYFDWFIVRKYASPAPVATVGAGEGHPGVSTTITPSLQHGWVGDNLVYTVVVKNTGTITDNYLLILDDSLNWLHGSTGFVPAPAGWANHVVISELYPNPMDETYSEWVELYNPTGNAITIGGDNFGRISGAAPGIVYVDGTIPLGTVIKPYGFYLIGDNAVLADNRSWPTADFVPTARLTITNSNAGYGLKGLDNLFIDRFGYGTAPGPNGYEGTPFPTNPTADNYSYERKAIANSTAATMAPGGVHSTWGNGYDTDNNAKDFVMHTVATDASPQNSSSPIEEPRLTLTIGPLAPGENWTGQVWVIVSGTPCTTDNITITAASMTDNSYLSNAICQAHSAVCGVDIVIENKFQEGLPSTWLNYTIDVHNSGDLVDNIILSYIPDGWQDIIILPPVLIDVMPCEHRQATLSVHVPDNAMGCTYKDITVIAESAHCHVTDNDTATAHVAEVCGVEVTIDNKVQEGWPSQILTFIVNVHNSGNVVDNFVLTPYDSQWPTQDIWIDTPVLTDVAPCEWRQATLYVHIPENTLPSTYKDITVVADSQFCHATDNDIATVHVVEAPYCGVEVTIDNKVQEGTPSQLLAFTINVHNSGNVVDNFVLTPYDSQWPTQDIWIVPSRLEDLKPCDIGQATLYVHIPDGTLPSTYKDITVVAESEFCHATDNDIATVHVIEAPYCGVEVVIENKLLEGLPSQWLNFTIDVHNSGNVVDNILLSYIHDGWPDIIIIPPVLTDVLPCEVRQATMLVHVPDNALPCTYKEIIVIAESQFCGLSDNDNAFAHVMAPPVVVENLQLVAGWNLVSFRVASENDTPANIFDNQTYYIWRWSAENKKYVNPPSDQPVELGVGYWVWVGYDQTVTTSGIPVDNYSINLKSGWNLVGFPVTSDNTTPANLFAGQTYYIWKWDAVNKKYVNPPSGNPVELKVGYWIWVAYDQTVTVPL